EPSGGSDRDMSGKTADRVAAEQRVDAEMDDLAIGWRLLSARRPRHVAIDDEDRVGVAEKFPRVVAKVAGMVGRQRQMPLAVLDDRDRETLGELGERRHRCGVA